MWYCILEKTTYFFGKIKIVLLFYIYKQFKPKHVAPAYMLCLLICNCFTSLATLHLVNEHHLVPLSVSVILASSTDDLGPPFRGSAIPEVCHCGDPPFLTLNPNPNPWRQVPEMVNLRNGGPPEWRAVTLQTSFMILPSSMRKTMHT